MSDEPITPMPLGDPIIPPPIEEWVSYTFDRFNPFYTPSYMNQVIEQASSDDGRWNYHPGGSPIEKWYLIQGIVTAILNAAVLDFREAYGAAFEEAAKDDKTLVPTSCLNYVDATFFYNVALYFGLYYLKADGVTKEYLTDYFYQAWKDASVYRRAIASARRMYREEIGAIRSADGTPVYIPRTETTRRSL
jgi:hypothetical protein